MNPFLLIALCCTLGGALLGGGAVNWKRLADIAELKTEQAKALKDAEKAYTDRYQAEVERGNALSERLAQTEQQLTDRTLEVSRAISKVTTGKRCLDSAAVRLLNRPTPSDHNAVPKATGQLAPESTAIATDTDVATWIGGAQYQYETCRARLNSLVDFETGRPDDRTKH